ncbi:MAG TPA: hypothetical protein VH165_14750 [Kofleriaceae bacterium]|jgi:hypothetical protein|nr:hypothetical protein [Kofleriaceae bacterium]
MTRSDLSRRSFLARIGVLGASTLLLPSCGPAPATATEAAALDLGGVVNLLLPVLSSLARDTMNGFVAFNLPGQDAYSKAQGTPRGEPGGMEAGGTDFLINNLDRFLPLPDQLIRPATAALFTALHDLPLPIAPGLLGLLGGLLGPASVTLGMLDDAVSSILANNETAPISLPVALLLNYVATVVNPLSVIGTLGGPFLSPFARLSFADKAKAMQQIETSQSSLVALLDGQIPEPAKDSVSGLLKFFGGALYEFAAFGNVGESQKFDPQTRTVTGRPVGWQLTGFLPDNQTGDGWDDLIGYYQDRREVTDV